MNGYNFTERVRKVLAMSREEAARLHHEYVGTEHILLGLIREGEGVAAAVLQSLTVDLEEIQQKIEDTVKKGRPQAGQSPDLPYTSRAKKVLEFAMSEARDLNHSYVGTEHLLLGLIREEKGIAAQVLGDSGLELSEVRTEVLRLLGTDAGASRQGAGHRPWLAQDVSRERNDSSPRTAMHDDGSIQAGRWSRSLTPQRWTSDRAHAVISRARADAAQRRSRYIEPEHLLLAILEEDGGMAATILERLAIDRLALTRAATGALEETVATQSEIMELDITFSTPARAVMRDAFHEARVTRDRVSTDHLLLGLLIEEKCPAARVLADAGLTAHAIRKQRERIAG